MKINLLDAHDRLKHFTNQGFDIGECCQNIIDQRPFGEASFYIFAHFRTIGLDERIQMFNEDLQMSLLDPNYKRKYQRLEDVPEKRGIWQPRLTKPKAQTNSILIKAYPGTDKIKPIWIIPPRELWSQFSKGLIMQNKTVSESIDNFQNHREKLEAKEPDDLDDVRIEQIYENLKRAGKMKKIAAKQVPLVVSRDQTCL